MSPKVIERNYIFPLLAFYLVWMSVSPSCFHTFFPLSWGPYNHNRLPRPQLPCVCSRGRSPEWFNLARYVPYSTPMRLEKTLSFGGEVRDRREMPHLAQCRCKTARRRARHWSRQTDRLMDIPYIASSRLMYLTCAFIPCLASHTFYYISLEVHAALHDVAKRRNSAEECGQFVWFEQQCWRYIPELLSAL